MNRGIPEKPIRFSRLIGADWESVFEIEKQVFSSDPWSPVLIREELSSANSFYVGAWTESNSPSLLGYAGIKGKLDADLMTMGVVGNHRGTGVGTQLLLCCLDWAAAQGCERVFLEVRVSNDAAISLYERNGFRRIGKVKNYYRNPTEDALTMRHVLGHETFS